MSDGRTSRAKLAEDKAVSVKTLNSAFAKLISKDKELVASGDGTPSIWEQRWYSDRLNRSLFYNKGGAVWLNTESVDDVVTARQDDLYAYSASIPAFRKKLDECLEAGDRA